ncbi:MAG TPA: amino acid adenylation domain-containing protein [Acidisarcina sp.]
MADNTITGFRLSMAQERVWGQQHEEKPWAARCVALIEGALDPALLRGAVAEAVGRHEILRTVFHRQSGFKVPFQVILDQSEPAWSTADMSGLDQPGQDREIEALMDRSISFDLEQGPVLHATLATLGTDKHALVLALPALSTDARGLENLVNEIGTCYAADLTGASASGDIMQYADIVQWQTELLESEEARAGIEFWRNHFRALDVASMAATLPLERKATADEFRGAVFSLELDAATVQRIERTMGGASVKALLLACWAALLGRLTGRTEIVIGVGLDGRKYEELETALGLFASSAPLQVGVPSGQALSEVLGAVSKSLGEFNDWQECFSGAPADASPELTKISPALGFEYVDNSTVQSHAGLLVTIMRERVCFERLKLKLVAMRKSYGLELQFHYDAARLDGDEVARIGGYFTTLLAAVVANPDVTPGSVPLLSAPEWNKVVKEWNATAADYSKDKCLHELFEAQAEKYPERAALRCGNEVLNYRELNERANQLAHYLGGLGVRPDSLVALCLERSVGTLVAMLGIMKAGGAYVALNPDNPKPRLARQIAGAVVLITQQSLMVQMPEFPGTTLSLDGPERPWLDGPRTNPEANGGPENLVYVIYTSGSTGVPKGVAVRHRNLVNYTQAIGGRLRLDDFPDGLHFATVSTMAADLGNTCIYPSLISGGCLHLMTYEDATDADNFARYTTGHPIDVLKIVPSHLQALLHSPKAKQILPRRFLVLGGETFSLGLAAALKALNPACEIFNHYGPTETTVGALTLALDHFDWRNTSAGSIPIGRPLANTQVYILDEHLQPVPTGVTGELYIAGAGVTAGYLNQPAVTGERFVSDPFAEEATARMYRTGDLARYLQDGNVEFLGRGDDQVKIRGFRIELGEIEAALLSHAAVKQALVLALDDETGDKRLLGYVVGEKDATSDALRAYVKQLLPDYMAPSHIFLLPQIPLTQNGKVDRGALPTLESLEVQTFVPPQTATQEAIAGIWAEVLRRERIGIHANFFDLGGHSLLATQVISRIRRTLDVDLPLRSLFESPTVAGLAEQVDHFRGSADTLTVPPITRVPRDQNLPLSFAQQRLWVLDQMEPNNAMYNIPRRPRMRGRLNIDALTRALNAIVERHESQRTTFGVRNGQPIQVIAPALEIELKRRSLAALPEDAKAAEATRVAIEEAETPFDLAKGPLLRATLLELGPEDHILLLTMHHIVSDAWSASVFFEEFGVLYEAYANGLKAELPELAIQYADYAAWQREWFQGEVLDAHIAYWRKQLSGAPPVLALPTDRPRPELRSFRGSYEAAPFSTETSKALREFSQQEGATLFMVLLAGFQTLLSRYTGQEQIVIGTDVANRAMAETERIIGFFINLLALHTDLSGNPSFRELLKRVREVALSGYAHQEMPFDKLVEELQPERSLSHNPLVQVLFVMQNVPRQNRALAGLEVSAFQVPLTSSKFDLAVFMVDGEEALAGNWVYSTDLFDKSTILRMARHFETLLMSAIASPDAPLSTLEMRSEAELEQDSAVKQERRKSQLKKLMGVETKPAALPQE